jgi:hypothetical protein
MTKGQIGVLRGGMGALAFLGLLWISPGWVADAAGSMTMRQAEPSHAYNAQFTFTRLRYGQPQDFGFFGGRGREPQWAHDYPRSDRNFVSILEFLTNTHTRLIETNVLDVDDPELLKFPVAYLSEPGFWNPTEREVEAMRTYLLKGGFLILDDFGGARDWANTERQFERVLPGFRWEELRGEHPIFQTFFEVNAPENLFNYRGAPIYFALFDENDPAKRVMVIANYNNDIGEFWEFADAGILPVAESNTAFQIGINYVIYAMSR